MLLRILMEENMWLNEVMRQGQSGQPWPGGGICCVAWSDYTFNFGWLQWSYGFG